MPMKKSIPGFLIYIFITFWGCEKGFDSLVDQNLALYQVTGVRTIDSVRYIPNDSLVLITITFNQSTDLRSVFTDIYASDGSKLNQNSFNLLDNGKAANGDFVAGDNTYSNKFPLSQFYPNGTYIIKYYAEDKNNSVKQVAIQNFKYDNGQANIAPILSNLAAPDSAKLDTIKTLIFLSVDAEDQNGQNDIESVFFNSFIPPIGNPSSNNPFIMYDDGTNGDQASGDGIYSLIVELPPPPVVVVKGTYRWEFQARDRGKKLSNKIIHSIVIY
ncbi:MAG: hypothetical protein A2315_14705 [Ignavibacteria bacterium RIFOXYB2_FULL_35_12]|nr:MAG: hypothetical protein A2455_01760 [Ignavibacteria bacterium RIFOXYC2_FULL_35_16]OGV04843.1 MAG: hypothetical protein A2315_14705 [Ignavibacteria bacterium RIFOXYB2_FULL_35_12]